MTGEDGHPQEEQIGDRDTDVEDMEDVAPTASGSHEARAPKVLREPGQPSAGAQHAEPHTRAIPSLVP